MLLRTNATHHAIDHRHEPLSLTALSASGTLISSFALVTADGGQHLADQTRLSALGRVARQRPTPTLPPPGLPLPDANWRPRHLQIKTVTIPQKGGLHCTAEVVTQSGTSVHYWAELHETGGLSSNLGSQSAGTLSTIATLAGTLSTIVTLVVNRH